MMNDIVKSKRDAFRNHNRQMQIDQFISKKRKCQIQNSTQTKITFVNHYIHSNQNEQSPIQIVGEYQYNENDIISIGSFSTVYKGYKTLDKQFQVAIKKINLKDQGKFKTQNEIEILKKLRSKFIVILYAAYQIESSFYLVLEMCDDTLQSRLNTITNLEGLKYFQQILKGIEILHNQRTYQLKNNKYFLLLFWVKLADFGFAKEMFQLSTYSQKCGTPYTMAPEVLMADNTHSIKYTDKQDVWSLGVILHQLYYKQHPFNGLVSQLISNERIMKKSSDSVIDGFIDSALQQNQDVRMSFIQVLKHPIRTYTPIVNEEEQITQQQQSQESGQKHGKLRFFETFISKILNKFGPYFS